MKARGAAAPTSAYVLHHYDWSESSLIVDLFTREAGRVVVAAKGAKRPTSQLRSVLMPFQRIAVHFARSVRDEAASEVHNLRGAEWAGGPAPRGGDALLAGFYLNELLMHLLARDDPHPVLWDAYAATLPWLGGPEEAAALRAFELVLLAETGHLPHLAQVTATLVPVEDARRYQLRPEAGLVAVSPQAEEATLSGGECTQLQTALAARGFDALRSTCRRCEPPLRRQLRQWLAYHLGRATLHTRDLVRELQALSPSVR